MHDATFIQAITDEARRILGLPSIAEIRRPKGT